MKNVLFILLMSLKVFAQDEESEALRALRLSCQQNVGLGCYNYANMLLKRDQTDNANKYFEMGCKLEHAESCSKKSWSALDEASSSETVSADGQSVDASVSATGTASLPESAIEETPTQAPPSLDESSSASLENQTDADVPSESESPSPDLSAIE